MSRREQLRWAHSCFRQLFPNPYRRFVASYNEKDGSWSEEVLMESVSVLAHVTGNDPQCSDK